MPLLLKCPSCERALRVPDELLGKKVKCPSCGTTFEAEPPPSEPPSAAPEQPETLSLPPIRLSLDDDPSAPEPPPLGTPQSVSPTPPPPLPESSPPEPDHEEPSDSERDDEDEHEDDRPWERRRRRRQVRRDCEPHRGSMILVLGIVSIPLAMVGMCCGFCSYGIGGLASVVGLGLAIPGWVMGRHDLARMRAGEMDPEGESQTQSGMICAIIGTVLNALGVLLSLAMLVFILFMVLASNSGPRPGPFVPPPPPPPPQFDRKLQAHPVPTAFVYLPRRPAWKG